MIFYSPFEFNYLWLPVIGFIIGLLATLIGAGGGLFFIFILVLLFKISVPVAVTTSLAATLPICLVGSIRHFFYGNINVRVGLIFSVTGVAGALIGANVTGLLTAAQLKISFGLYTILLAVQIFYNTLKDKKTEKGLINPKAGHGLKNTAKGSGYGFLAGIVTGTFGTSGAAPVLAGLLSMRISVKKVVGTSLIVVLINTIFALAAHFFVGKTDLTLVYFLGGGAAVGAFAGPKLLAGYNFGKSEGRARLFYAIGLAVIGILMIFSKQ